MIEKLIELHAEDTRSVDELLSFINGDSSIAASKRHHFSNTSHSHPVQSATGSLAVHYGLGPIASTGGTKNGLNTTNDTKHGSSIVGTTLPTRSEAPNDHASGKSAKKVRQRARRKRSAHAESSPHAHVSASASECTADKAEELKAKPQQKLPAQSSPEPKTISSTTNPATRKSSRKNTKKKSTAKTETLKESNYLLEEEVKPSLLNTIQLKDHKDDTQRTQRHKAKNNRTTQVKASLTSKDSKAANRKDDELLYKEAQLIEDHLDPALEAQIDKEVEEFRLRLESHSKHLERRPIPSSLRATLTHLNVQQLKKGRPAG